MCNNFLLIGVLMMLGFSGMPIHAEQMPDVVHGVIFSDPRLFAGWPANYGIWQWDDEVLVSFALSPYQQRGDFHNIDDKAYQCEVFARSLDAGKTWQIETHPEVSIPGRFDDTGRYIKDDSYPAISKPTASPGGIQFDHPDFALRSWKNHFYISYDRGHHWQGPYNMPTFGYQTVMARTNYLVTGPSSCRLFFSVTNMDKNKGEHGRTLMAQTTDGGKTFEMVSWVTADPLDGLDEKSLPAYAIMPGILQMDDGTILSANRWRIRRTWWIDLMGSTDQGRTWKLWSELKIDNSNPASLVNLGGKRIAMVYGWRNRPYGLRGRISQDGGHTWSDEYVLRDDGREWDLGYVRAVVLKDGRVLIIYYYTTKQLKPEHIAYTIWTPPSVP
ncbi:MAG: hypothetical protein CMJ19_06330 [Phycisphaeraceae bacterium]|nr:hypothetical protein [Phycisphaeraceae bacterium]